MPDDSFAEEWLGLVLDERYRIDQVIGRGGNGVVFVGEQVRIGQRVAIKIVSAFGAPDDNAIRRLEREARTVSLIDHENIVKVHDFGLIGSDSAYLVMEYLEGLSLEEAIAAQGSLPLAGVCHILIQAAHAIEAAHSCGVIHRDIKPANLFLADEGVRRDVTKILDFGIAALRDSAFDRRTTTLSTEVTLGTPGYLAPEQAASGLVDSRADIYSFGVTMYHMLTGALPIEASSPIEALWKTCHADPVPIADRVPDLPLLREVETLLMSMLAKDVLQRPQSMREVRARLVQLRRLLNEPTRRAVEQFTTKKPSRRLLTTWIANEPGRTTVHLAGMLDERADLTAVGNRLTGPEIAVNLSRITHVNSTGHSVWVAWLREVQRAGLDVTLHECSVVMVRQANLDPAVIAGAPVKSFFAPFYCRHCDREAVHLELADEVRRRGLAVHTCEQCGNSLALDEVEKSYLGFLGITK